MYTLEYIIQNKLPLTDYQQLILDCRVTSENIIKQKIFSINITIIYLNTTYISTVL